MHYKFEGCYTVCSYRTSVLVINWRDILYHIPLQPSFLIHKSVRLREINIIIIIIIFKVCFNFDFFRLEFFNASDWVRIFEESGARYVVLTSKHHEGFTMWPSKYSFSWNSMDVSQFKTL